MERFARCRRKLYLCLRLHPSPLQVAQAAQLLFDHPLLFRTESDLIGSRTGSRGFDLYRMRGKKLGGEYFFDHAAIQMIRHGQARREHHRRHEIADRGRSRERRRVEARPFADQDALGPVIAAPPESAAADLLGWLTHVGAGIPVYIEVAGARGERAGINLVAPDHPVNYFTAGTVSPLTQLVDDSRTDTGVVGCRDTAAGVASLEVDIDDVSAGLGVSACAVPIKRGVERVLLRG